MKNKIFKKAIFVFLGFVFLSLPSLAFGQENDLTFNVDSNYDSRGRSEVEAFLYRSGENTLFFVESAYYTGLSPEKKDVFSEDLKNLSAEFDNLIYPKLTSIYGSEWNPGIDGDGKITILITQMKDEMGGYFNEGDEYPKAQFVSSNEREMIYFNAKNVGSSLAKSYLAHEFVHLITFNQKNRLNGVSEDIWLNEARAEMAPTLLGYDDDFEGSNLQRRTEIFLQRSTDSLTEWKGNKYDYGVLNIFFQYVLDHYGVKVLTDSLESPKTGIDSLNYALNKNLFLEDFSQIFTNWTITVLINDCNYGNKYCFLIGNLGSLRVFPQLNYLPLTGASSLTVGDYTSNWSANWYKLVGGNGDLKVSFKGDNNADFKVFYLTRDSSDNYALSVLPLDTTENGFVVISDFKNRYKSFFLIETIQEESTGPEQQETFSFSWTASIESSIPDQQDSERIAELLAQIEYLNNEIAKIQERIRTLMTQKTASCTFDHNLYMGIKDSEGVKCLQEFLKNQGKDIYSEGLVTGYFGSLTKSAVIRFQGKYSIPTTGFVGQLTRAKINNLFDTY